MNGDCYWVIPRSRRHYFHKFTVKSACGQLVPDSVAGKTESGKYVIVYIRSVCGLTLGEEKPENIIFKVVQPSD